MAAKEGSESATTAQVAKAAAECPMLQRAVALGQWVGPDGRALTSVGVLRKPDVPAACAAIGIALPERFRSAGDIQDLHRPWTVALALGLLAVNGNRAASGPALGEWPPPSDALGAQWVDALLAVCDAISQDARQSLGLRLSLIATLRILSGRRAGRQQLAFHEMYAVVHAIGDDSGLTYGDFDLTGGTSDISRAFLYDTTGALLDLLAAFGAVTVPPGGIRPLEHSDQETRDLPVITPLGRWAAEALAATLPRAVAPDASPEEAIAAAADTPRAGRWGAMRRWLDARKPEAAVRELMEAADPMPARLRAAAVEVALMTAEDGLPGWAVIAGNAATWPNSAHQARAELSVQEAMATGTAPSLDDADRHWIGVEGAAEALGEGADEVLCRLWEAADSADTIEGVLAWARASGHPEAEQVSDAVTALVASGTPLTIRQGIQLKVTLRHYNPPTWRSVQVPLLSTLGDLHRVIQVLFGWDGDHLHDFTVGATHYSDPFFGLEETENEEDARLRDLFPAGARKPVLYEYDLGESWIHEITREKAFALDPARSYPACVAFSGEQPVEYQYDEDEDEFDEDEDEDEDEGQPAGREPFSLTAVNAALTSRS